MPWLVIRLKKNKRMETIQEGQEVEKGGTEAEKKRRKEGRKKERRAKKIMEIKDQNSCKANCRKCSGEARDGGRRRKEGREGEGKKMQEGERKKVKEGRTDGRK